MPRKRRLLFVGEASFLATGFSTYWNEVIRRIHATGEFEIAEIGSYANANDPRCHMVPWKFYPVGPDTTSQEQIAQYNSRQTNQFGEWRFDDVCLEFQPDIVCAIRDWWMDEFILRSPFRKHFKFVWMPTVDGAPQRDIWMDSYELTDHVLTYSQFGYDVLKKQGGDRINLVGLASPGADLGIFSPVPDKAAHKARFGIDPEDIIIGTVMRNQKRKLYYDLIEAFATWTKATKRVGKADLLKKVHLYLHTSYPDVGFDIAKAAQEFGISNRILMTYLCTQCHTSFPSYFSGEWTTCRKCGKPTAHPPNANHHLDRSILAAVMNLFDVYVQYSICEGWGMPIVEAKACGVPTMCVNYSAMEDHANSPGGIPIRVQRYFYESVIETEQRRALPSNQDFVDKLNAFLRLSPARRRELGLDGRRYCEELSPVYGQEEKLPRFSYDRVAAIWQNLCRQMPIADPATTWLNPEPQLVKPKLTPPRQDLTNAEFVRWVIREVWCRPEMARTNFASEWIRSLNCGFRFDGANRVPLDRNGIVRMFLEQVEKQNQWELRRVRCFSNERANQFPCKVI